MAKRDAWGSVIDGAINTGLAIGTAGLGGGETLFGKLFGGKGAGAAAGQGLATQVAQAATSSPMQNVAEKRGWNWKPQSTQSKFYFGG
jgi:hypothetical protein